MKKLLAMLLAMVMVFSLAACAQGGTTNGVSATEKTAAPDNNGEKDSSTSTGDSDSIDVGVCLIPERAGDEAPSRTDIYRRDDCHSGRIRKCRR